ncbi:hypothetical protein [Streptomyces venetus]|uniref:hypothetical protein n=1 Tax=Streptomyces venetus TaxID=1701086 RepID=UPI003CD095DB
MAVAKYAWSGRERLGLLRVRDDVIVLHAMRWPDKIRAPETAAPARRAQRRGDRQRTRAHGHHDPRRPRRRGVPGDPASEGGGTGPTPSQWRALRFSHCKHPSGVKTQRYHSPRTPGAVAPDRQPVSALTECVVANRIMFERQRVIIWTEVRVRSWA